ncbi:MAG: cyclic nucleotide-binding domain-containing protein, partial [Pseudomonadota bacterium]
MKQEEANRGQAIAAHQRYEQLDLFRGVDLTSVEHLLDRCSEVRRAAGEVVLQRGEENDSLFQILSGQLTVELHHKSESPAITLGTGACVGELSILSGVDVSARVVATTDCELLIIPGDIVWSFTNSS